MGAEKMTQGDSMFLGLSSGWLEMLVCKEAADRLELGKEMRTHL
jgi:hypothetical protein